MSLPITAAERAWVESCLTAIALDPETGQPSIGLPLRRHVVENHRLVCGACRNDWRKIDSDESWYGVCACCGSDHLLVESEPVPGAPPTGEWELQCGACDATWTGIPGDPCDWCNQAAERQRDHQADLVLTAPDVNPNDVTYEARMEGWTLRMAVALDAGIITHQQATNAARSAMRVGAA